MDRIKLALESRGLTPYYVEQKAKAAGIKDLFRQTIDNWIEGRASPTVRQLEKLAEVLGCEVRDLV